MKKIVLVMGFISLSFISQTFGEPITPPESGDLIDLKGVPEKSVMKTIKSEVTVVPQEEGNAIRVAFKGGRYPGVSLVTPEKQGWNLSGYGSITVEVLNSGTTIVNAFVRVDNPPSGNNKEPWITSDPVSVNPGETRAVSVIFDKKRKKEGFELDPSCVVAVMVFTVSPQEPGEFMIKSVKAMK